MRREAIVSGRTARLAIEDGELTYEPEDAAPVIGTVSVECAGPGTHSVLMNDRVYRVTRGARGEWLVNGRTLAVQTFDPRDRRARQIAALNQGVQYVESPMPGRVVRVLVAVGDLVEPGQGLVVVEAMKMQNEMKSPKAGRISEVRTAADATVNAGQILVIVE